MARYQQGLLVSCQLPWDDKERVLEEILRQQVGRFRHYYNHLYFFGTAEEGYAVGTKRVIEAPDYRRIVDAIPNLAATKNTGGGLARVSSLMRIVPELQHFFGEINFAHGCLYGECSQLPSFGPMSPHKITEYFEAGRTHQVGKLFAMQKEFEELLSDLLGRLLAEARIDGVYDKILTRLGGLEGMPMRMLSTYQGYEEATYPECKRILHTKYPSFVALEHAPIRSEWLTWVSRERRLPISATHYLRLRYCVASNVIST